MTTLAVTGLSAEHKSWCRWPRAKGDRRLLPPLPFRVLSPHEGRCPEGEGPAVAPWIMRTTMDAGKKDRVVILGEWQRKCHNYLRCHEILPLFRTELKFGAV